MKTQHLCLALVAGLLVTTPASAEDAVVAPYGARAWRNVSFGEAARNRPVSRGSPEGRHSP